MQESLIFIGVDVSKASLSCAIEGSKAVHDLANDAAAISAWLESQPVQALIAVESTGRHHRLLVTLAQARGHRTFVLNAQDVFFYARSLGCRGKTDRKDACVIAHYLAEHHRLLRPWSPPPAMAEELRELLRCRAGVAHKQMSLKMLLRHVASLARDAQLIDRQLDELLGSIDARISAVIANDEDLGCKCANLRTITGIGLQGAAMLAALFTRITFRNADAVVAYSGLDPRPCDSGTMTGRRRLSKRGDPLLRRQMYLAAFAATRSKVLGPFYRALKAKGFKPTQAMVILARKLLRIAWSLWNSGHRFNPAMHSSFGA